MAARRVAIEIAPYTLRLARRFPGPGAGDDVARRGALLRFRFLDEDRTGHADCFPWPSLGDAPLDEQVRALADGRLTSLTRKSWAFARADAAARAGKRSLWDDVLPIPNHFSGGDAAALSARDLDEIVAGGFFLVKFKMGRDLQQETARLREHFGDPGARRRLGVRLDYNGAFGPGGPASVERFLRHWDALGAAVRDRVDWVEDPLAWDAPSWALVGREGVPLALDRERPRLQGRLVDAAESFAFCVLKPAVDRVEDLDVEPPEIRARIAFTSYLDHPVGQAAAIWEASRFYRRHVLAPPPCGLATHLTYEPTPYSRALCVADSIVSLSLPGGDRAGLGFGGLLDATTFRPLATVEESREAAP